MGPQKYLLRFYQLVFSTHTVLIHFDLDNLAK